MSIDFFAEFLTKELYIDEATRVGSLLESMGIRGLVLVLFMTVLGVIFGMFQCRRVRGMDAGLCIVGAAFVLGNLYKIPQCVGYILTSAENANKILETASTLKTLRILCPFSWLNPINIYNRTLEVTQLWIYVVLTLVLAVVTGIWYCKRDWLEI